jgi:NitT/TauT family transport system substrate-binding protein
MSKSKVMGAALLALAAFFSTAASAQTAAVKGETVRIQKYPGVVSMLVIVAAERGYCTKYGINCVPTTMPSSVLGLQSMLSGGLEIATPAVEPALQLAAKGTPIRFVGTIARNSLYMFASGKQKSGTDKPKPFPELMHDFKNKKIGVTTRGSGPEYTLKSMLAAAGMKDSDVTIVAVGGPDTAYPALINKQVDATISFEPMGAFCEVLKTCDVDVWLSRGEGPDELKLLAGAYAPMVVREEYAANHPEVITAFRSALRDAETFIHDDANFDELLRLARRHFKMDHPQSNALITAMVRNTLPNLYYEIDPRGVQAAMDYMVRTGQLAHAFDVSGLVWRKE